MNILLSLAAALIAGLLFTRVMKPLNLPNVTGFLIAGLLIGPSLLGWIPRESLEGLEELVTLALGFIAFSIGAEFKVSHLKRIGSKAITITLFQAAMAVGLVDIVLIAFGFDLPLALTLGAIAAATAPAATLMVVRQYKAKGPVTSTLLPVVAMDDAIGLMVFSISVAISQSLAANAQFSGYQMLVKPILEIIFSLGLGAMIGLAATLSMRFFHSRNNFLMICIAAVMLGVALSEMWELSSLLLCMSIGVVFANLHKNPEPVLELCDRWTPALFLLFFVISGAELDLAAIPAVGMLGALYILARSVGKYVGTFIGAQVVKAEPAIRKYLGVALLPQAGVAIGMAQLASTALPAYGAQIRTVVLCATLIYELFGPVMTKIALTKAGEIERVKKVKKVKGSEA